ncbi:glycosyltransferase family 4 protein [Alkalinema sp. FACHB-956]|uniref:glycosyltransferase family 4 protein n=1 Tax=Alkalinema sp. FACHB-956 TaxID=2692768 RepID=UPI001683FD64|nr:glycosyltransferase family 4 protein [Alkalinema sp. FACHB-956]MBD2329622.1 glycosyltransferase family 4 protein [Alkalinema sp. FACHB-956]
MKIACYGYVYKNTGSVAGANFLILEELLKRGLEIDFFGWDGFNKPHELLDYSNFKFIELPKGVVGSSIYSCLPTFLKEIYKSYLWPAVHVFLDSRIDQKYLQEEIILSHHSQHYDVMLFLSVNSKFKVKGLPIVSWLQGTPQTEWQYIQKLRSQIIKYGGSGFYLKAAVHYTLEAPKVGREIANSDLLICESAWSRDRMIEYGVAPERLRILPYPINLELFQPPQKVSLKSNTDKKTFLWLGRIDPRKRFDLMIAAYELLLQERQDVHLKVVGGFRHVPGYRKLMEPLLQKGQMEYIPFVPRSEIPQLLHECDVVVQPSEAENFGSSIAEALCCGLPVVLGSTNGTKDFIGESGILFEEYTPEALKDAMITALEKLDRDRNQVIANNRKVAEQSFNVDWIADQMISALQKVVESVAY